MKQLLRIFAAVLMFAGILAGCMTALLLLILMVRFPPLLICAVLACWFFSKLQNTKEKPSQQADRTSMSSLKAAHAGGLIFSFLGLSHVKPTRNSARKISRACPALPAS